MPPTVNLRELTVQRDAAPTPPRRALWTRFVLPGLLLVGFVGLVLYALRESLVPPREVTVLPVILAQATLDLPPDTALFRAAGWVEPRPTATLVTALSEGVVDQLLVVEGQEVKQGQLLARLVDAEARLAVEAAEADVQLRDGELLGTKAALVAAKARLARPVHLQVDLADAEAALAKAESEQTTLNSQLRSARARQSAAQRDWDYRRTSAVVPEASVAKSKSELESADAAVEEVLVRQKRLPIEVAALTTKRAALKHKLEHKVEETHQLARAEADVTTAEARLRQARAARDLAALRLERMHVKAPAAGRVLHLLARPGMRLTGLNPGSLQDSSTVLTLYDPSSLQVRVDVRLDDLGKIQSGQKVRIETAAVPGKALAGEVLLATSQADVQKNTLSVKVAIGDPPLALKPEMLCQVTFLAPPRPAGPAPGGKEPYRLLIPGQLVDGGSAGARVWVADQLTGRAQQRLVDVGASVGDLVEVRGGLASSEKLIVGGRESLKDGARIRVVGEDETLGISKRQKR